jgi:hypothetical protein
MDTAEGRCLAENDAGSSALVLRYVVVAGHVDHPPSSKHTVVWFISQASSNVAAIMDTHTHMQKMIVRVHPSLSPNRCTGHLLTRGTGRVAGPLRAS